MSAAEVAGVSPPSLMRRADHADLLSLQSDLESVRAIFFEDRLVAAAEAGDGVLERVLALVPVPQDLLADTATLQARIARRRDRNDEALRHIAVALHAAQALSDGLRESLARAQRAHVLSMLGLVDEGLEESYAALKAGGGLPAAEAAGFEALGDVQWTLAAWNDALQSYGRAGMLAQQCGDLELQAIAQGGLGGVEHGLGAQAEADGRFDEAKLHYRRSADHALEYVRLAGLAGSVYGERTGRHNHAIALMGLGEWAEARAMLEAMLASIESESNRDQDSHRALTLKNLGDIDIEQGDTAAALARAQQAFEMFERLDEPPYAMVCCEALCKAHEIAGNFAEALKWHRRFHAFYVRVASSSAQSHASAMAVKYETDVAKAVAEAQRSRADRLEQSHRSLSQEAERLARASLEDALTGLANRRRFDQALPAALSDRRVPQRCSLALIDVDHFKRVNDEFSHIVGDEVLRRLGAILASNARREDLAARYGGEEFALILQGLTPDAAMLACDRLRVAVESADWASLHPRLKVTISIGLAHRDALAPEEGAESLLKLADERLYEAKRGGRNRVVDCSPLSPLASDGSVP